MSLKKYIIFATQRTGSTLICDILYNLKYMSKIDPLYEILHGTHLNSCKNTNEIQFLSNCFTRYQINGISGFKIMPDQLRDYYINNIGFVKASEKKNIFKGQIKFIWIKRRNTLRQAISWRLAQKRRIWKMHTKRTLNTKITMTDSEIDYYIHMIRWNESQITNILKVLNVKPLILYYEDFEDDQTSSIESILAFVGIAHTDLLLKTALLKQSDTTTEEIIDKYRGILTKNKHTQASYFFMRRIMQHVTEKSLVLRSKSTIYNDGLNKIKKLFQKKDN